MFFDIANVVEQSHFVIIQGHFDTEVQPYSLDINRQMNRGSSQTSCLFSTVTEHIRQESSFVQTIVDGVTEFKGRAIERTVSYSLLL